MILLDACRRLNKYKVLLFYPIIIDFLALMVGLSFIRFYGEPKRTFQVILETGMPSISHILDYPLLVNTFKYLSALGDFLLRTHEAFPDVELSDIQMPALAISAVIGFILLYAFAQGGFIGMLHRIVHNESISFRQFLIYASRFWLRFFLLTFILLALQLSILTFFSFMFQVVIGMFSALATFLFLRIYFIYFEFSIVTDDVWFMEALSNSRKYLKNRVRDFYIVVPVIFVTAGILSLILHSVWSISAVVLFIFIYAYVMSATQIALMMTLQQAKNELY